MAPAAVTVFSCRRKFRSGLQRDGYRPQLELLEPRMLLANDLSITDFVVFGSASVNFDENVFVSGGLLGSNRIVAVQGDSQTTTGIRSGGDVSVHDNALVIGDVAARGKVEIGRNANVMGDVTAGGEVVLETDGAHVIGNVLAGGDLRIEKHSTVLGDAGTAGDAELQANATVTGELIYGGKLKLGPKSVVGGAVTKGPVTIPSDRFLHGAVTVEDGETVSGDINAEGNVQIGKQATVKGHITATGDVYVEVGSQINGDVLARGRVELDKSVTVTGNVIAGGDVSLREGGAHVVGNVLAGGALLIEDDSTVTGDAITNGDAELMTDAEVTGDLTHAGKVILAKGAEVGGTVTHSPVTVPPLPKHPLLPTAISFRADGPPFATGSGETVTLEPGVYGALKLGKENTLFVSSGRYFFNQFTAANDLDLHLDVTEGAIDIFVDGDTQIKEGLQIFINGVNYVDADPSWAASIYMEAHGNWTLEQKSQWMGTVFSPHDKIDVGSGTAFAGAFYSGTDVAINADGIGTFVAAERFLPPVVSARLDHDEGASDTEGVTSDLTVVGTVTDANKIAAVRAGFDDVEEEGYFDVPLDSADGTFLINASLVDDAGITLTDGPHVVHLQAEDEFGNVSDTVDVLFILDRSGPTVTIDTPAADSWSNSNVTVSGQATDALSGVATLQAQVDGGPFLDVSFDRLGNYGFETSLAVDGTADGPHAVRLRATDKTGNVSVAVDRSFTLDSTSPTVVSTSPEPDVVLGPELAGNILVSLTFSEPMDAASVVSALSVSGTTSGPVAPIEPAYDEATRTLSLVIDASVSDTQFAVALRDTATDLAGNGLLGGTFSYRFSVERELHIASITEISPAHGEELVSTTRDAVIRFTEAIDPATLTANAVQAIAQGGPVPGRLLVSSDQASVTFIPDVPWPASSEVRLRVDGDEILARSGESLDADGDGNPGGIATAQFRTVPLARIPGTNVTGRVVASQRDAFGEDVPLEGVTVRVEGHSDVAAVTDANGFFTLVDTPSPVFFVHVDGTTATREGGQPIPDTGFYPNVGERFHSVRARTVPLEVDGKPFDIHLPFVPDEAIHAVVPGQDTTVTPPLQPTTRDPDMALVSLAVPDGSLIHDDGTPGTEVGILAVDADRLPAPLPGRLVPGVAVTVQADADRFDVAAPVTLPNVDQLAPGAKTLLMAFDDARGEWGVVGTMTVAEDGQTVLSDPGVGIRSPGWYSSVAGTVHHVTAEPAELDPGARDDRLTGLGDDPRLYYRYTLEDGSEIAGRSRADGTFSRILPPDTQVTLEIYRPSTQQYFSHTDRASSSGSTTHDLAPLVPIDDEDADGDGIPDAGERVMGTRSDLRDTDEDGIDDAVEIVQRLDPLDRRQIPTGIMSTLALTGEAREVVIERSSAYAEAPFAYVATGRAGIAVVDASQFDLPIVVGQLALPGDASDVAVDPTRGIAVVTSGAGGLHFVDVSDPMLPSLVRTVDVSARQVDILDGTAYVAAGSRLEAYDVVTGEHLDTLDGFGATINGMAREGWMLYTMDDARMLQAIDIRGLDMVGRGTLSLPGTGGKLFVGNGIAYAAAVNARGGFATADVSDPDHLVIISESDVVSPFVAPNQAMVANGSGIGVLVGTPPLTVSPTHALDLMDLSDPAKTNQLLTRINLPSSPSSLAVAAGLAFVAGGTSGLHVVNYLPFDDQGLPPAVTINTNDVDLDPDVPGIQVREGTSVPIVVHVRDDVQVRNVELLVDGQVVQNDVSFPFELSAIALGTSPADRLVTVQARAIDTGGNWGLSDGLELQLVPDTMGPSIVGTRPRQGEEIVTSIQTFQLAFSEALDPAAVTADAFRLRGSIGGVLTPMDVQLQKDDHHVQLVFSALAPDAYQLTVDASTIADRAGNVMVGSDFTLDFTVTTASLEPEDFSSIPNQAVTQWAGAGKGRADAPSDGMGSHIAPAVRLRPAPREVDLLFSDRDLDAEFFGE